MPERWDETTRDRRCLAARTVEVFSSDSYDHLARLVALRARRSLVQRPAGVQPVTRRRAQTAVRCFQQLASTFGADGSSRVFRVNFSQIPYARTRVRSLRDDNRDEL